MDEPSRCQCLIDETSSAMKAVGRSERLRPTHSGAPMAPQLIAFTTRSVASARPMCCGMCMPRSRVELLCSER